MSNEYIHYGHRHFNPNQFVEIENYEWMSTKPKGGLWASALDVPLSWRRWCEVEEFPYFNPDRWFKFRLKPNARILYVDNTEILKDLPDAPNPRGLSTLFWEKHLDFVKLKEQYDAIEISLSKCSDLYSVLMAWDCDSILILNKDVIEEIDSSDKEVGYEVSKRTEVI